MNNNKITYPDRESWLASRKYSIGASDVPVILGINKYKSAYTLWCEKTGRIEQTEAGLPAEVGLALEPLIAKKYADATGYEIEDPGQYTVYCGFSPWFRCTPDRIAFDGNEFRAVELKSIGEFAAQQMRDGEPPLTYQVQVQAQLAVLGLEYGDLACLIGNRKFEIFPFVRHDRLIKQIEERVTRFHDCMVNDTPTEIDNSISTFDTIRKLHPYDNGETVELGAEATAAFVAYEKLLKEIDEKECALQGYKNILLDAIGSNSFASAGGRVYSYTTQETSGRLTVPYDNKDALEKAGITFKETKPSKTRVFRVKKGQANVE